MTTLTIKHQELEAVALAVSTDPLRYYLNGVAFEDNGGMIATDGHRLHSMNTADGGKIAFIMASDDVKNAVAMAKQQAKSAGRAFKDMISIKLHFTKPEISVSIMLGDEVKASFICKEVDGNFPDWRRVLPSESDALKEIGVSAVYLADFGKAAKILGYKREHLELTFKCPDSAIRVAIKGVDNFDGVLMPCRL